MNSSITLQISHISGLQHQNDVTITLHRDALLDHEDFEQHLTSEQFTWLANSRCTVRCCPTGITPSWWLQHGSHQYTCSINDQLIACSDSIQLHIGDRIEMGMLRLEVMDIAHQQYASLPPALPLAPLSHTTEEVPPVITDLTANTSITEDDMFSDIQTLTDDDNTIPLLTDMVESTAPVDAAQQDDTHNMDDAAICMDDIQQELLNIAPAYTPEEKSIHEDDVLAQLEQQFETALHQPQQFTASTGEQTNMSLSSIATSFEHDLIFYDAGNSASLSDDISLEETLLGTLSIHQALAHLQTDEENVDDIISASSEFDLAEQHISTDVLALFADTTVTPKNSLSTQHIHQSFPDSFCDIGTETVSFDVDTIIQETR